MCFCTHDAVFSPAGLSDEPGEFRGFPRRREATGHGGEGQQAHVRLPAELNVRRRLGLCPGGIRLGAAGTPTGTGKENVGVFNVAVQMQSLIKIPQCSSNGGELRFLMRNCERRGRL